MWEHGKFLNVEVRGTYSYHWVLKGQMKLQDIIIII
jgi:hypothetical protein